MMICSKLDLFSSQFTFNVGGQHHKKGTLFGSFTSILIVIAMVSYSIYLFRQYDLNQIQPNYKSQNFITEETITIDLNSDLIGFRFEHSLNKSIDILEKENGKTYVVFLAYFLNQDENENTMIPLDIIKCSSKNLKGYYCLDFTKVSDIALTLNSNQGVLSQIKIFTYGCLDIDAQKKYVPDNCASQAEIDYIINAVDGGIKFRLYTSQFNTQTRKIQTNYRTFFIYTMYSAQILSTFKAQKQVTSVTQGMLIQDVEAFSSPLEYDLQNQTLSRSDCIAYAGVSYYSQVAFLVDEMYQEIQIQYPTLPQVLALVNGVFTLLMISGVLCRAISKRSIKKDFMMLFLQSIYPGSYLKMLKSMNLHQGISQTLQNKNVDQIEARKKEVKKVEKKSSLDEIEEKIEGETNKIPSFFQKQKLFGFMRQASNQKVNHHGSCQNLNNVSNTMSSSPIKQNAKNSLIVMQQEQFLFEKSNRKSQTNLLVENQSLPNQFQDNQECLKKSESNILSFSDKALSVNSIQKMFSNIKPNQTKEINTETNQNNSNQLQKFNLVNNFNFSEKIRRIIFGYKCCNKKEYLKSKGINQQMVKLVENQVNKGLDILQVYQDIILLKKAIMMILTKDQLASLQLIGCSSDYLNSNLSHCGCLSVEDQQNLSYYEQQFSISQSSQLQNQHIQQFLSRCQNNQSLSEIDYRIFTSICKDFNE
ncbi:AMP-binding enzyme family protein (macronuclear) [Tetrahymena thermophila SB210]|uniref:AMP-binding enzyme family protein n=1 Tax=Tetrahymena thermophila (strain SB210) TaxID=312017 RepID=Q22X68_TETTS|nr:AMP-binding enzyme family protein [Tetrahymena thermophila SB210]EAR89778.2 AMP-binding enzyme family protein [Tetrahymena thermophila SB210]|eukprot:XP_001010023.2 AMP-binding enzyme family protein [Tetrahymena thermophila SB210]